MRSVASLKTIRAAAAYIRLAAQGFAIGTAGLIPGVSGGTLALLLGIYEDLVEAIRVASDIETLKALVQRRWKRFLELLPWQMLLPLAVGALTAVILMSHFMEWLLLTYPVQVEAFFFGLVAASIVVVARKIQLWDVRAVVALILGALGAWVLMDVTPAQTPNTLWMLFLSGAVAKCAMVLPGISGAFVLVVFGQYQYSLAAVTHRDILAMGAIILGAVAGLVTFSQLLSWLFRRQRDLTLAVLAGLIFSSLRRLWPWRETTLSAAGAVLRQTNVLPAAWTPEVTAALLLAVGGFIMVVTLASVARSGPVPSQQAQSPGS